MGLDATTQPFMTDKQSERAHRKILEAFRLSCSEDFDDEDYILLSFEDVEKSFITFDFRRYMLYLIEEIVESLRCSVKLFDDLEDVDTIRYRWCSLALLLDILLFSLNLWIAPLIFGKHMKLLK